MVVLGAVLQWRARRHIQDTTTEKGSGHPCGPRVVIVLADPGRVSLSEGLLLLLRILQIQRLRLLMLPPMPCRLELRHQSLRIGPLGPPR